MARIDLPLDGGLSIALTGEEGCFGLRVLREERGGRKAFMTPPTVLTMAEIYLLGDAMKRFAVEHQGPMPELMCFDKADESVDGRELQSLVVAAWTVNL